MSGTAYLHLFKSCVKLCVDVAKEAVDAGLSPDIQFVNFEEHSTLYTLPNADVLGIGSFNVVLGTEAIVVDIGFAVSTINDDKMFRHAQIVDMLARYLTPAKSLPVYSANDLSKIGFMAVTEGTTLRYVERTEQRNIRMVMASMLTNPKYWTV